MSEWISVSEQVPSDSRCVIAVTDDYPQMGRTVTPARYKDGYWWDVECTDRDGYESQLYLVSLWHPLPPPPAE